MKVFYRKVLYLEREKEEYGEEERKRENVFQNNVNEARTAVDISYGFMNLRFDVYMSQFAGKLLSREKKTNIKTTNGVQ